MVSMGPNSQSTLYFHMSDFKDLRSDFRRMKINEDSILDILNKNPEFSKFRELVSHSQYESKLNDCNTTTTLFVPINDAFPEGFIQQLDRYQANLFILSNMFGDRVIPSELIEYSPYCIFPTKFVTPNYITVKNINGNTYINDCKIIAKDIYCKNGIIHVVDRLNIPKYYL